jgi:hypothetical protein
MTRAGAEVRGSRPRDPAYKFGRLAQDDAAWVA